MKPEIKKLLILNLPYLLFVWLFDKAGAAVRLSPGADASAKLLHLGTVYRRLFQYRAELPPGRLSFRHCGGGHCPADYLHQRQEREEIPPRDRIRFGALGGADDIKPYTDPVFENNIPLTQTERLTMNSRPKQPKYARNKNILVIGGSGSGKTRFFVKPSLMQCTSKDFPTSYIVTDPKVTII